ncbi:cytochrome d ubiquinol oxidase subunit II [Psychromicrobium silvestre]|uniref:Cytochrome d ubiquinol oxidase subunit II n=1 Tax=Psychromicrobium silvestre TaxID=1645614 RepID=A0A7Y9S3T0_9MICC|nr:cytochrome d ubiquinol oxidase subunit II [Psychromicrobium silvestre]NYE94038.1 cytochrome d ubiquinol oxidase subunit II [Psychromicrobium silvestre]
MDFLPTLWFVLIAVLWTGYLFLEGFDLGVGMLMKLFARNNTDRRVLLNTVGPVWDGNEVWLITAIGATFAAFPHWYAALLSSLYLPMILVLLGLIFRAVGFEYRGKVDSARWRTAWDWAIFLGSAVSAFGVGTALALTSTGLPLDANGDRVGGAFAWLNGYALLGGAAVVLFCLVHALAFLALKTDGEVRNRARRLFARCLPLGVLPMLAWALLIQLNGGKAFGWLCLAVAVLAVPAAVLAARRTREGWSFLFTGIFLLASISGIFLNLYPRVLPSTLSESFDLTVQNASSSPYTLGLMSIIACFGVPLVLAYQGWTYWVFRKRISSKQIPGQVQSA